MIFEKKRKKKCQNHRNLRKKCLYVCVCNSLTHIILWWWSEKERESEPRLPHFPYGYGKAGSSHFLCSVLCWENVKHFRGRWVHKTPYWENKCNWYLLNALAHTHTHTHTPYYLLIVFHSPKVKFVAWPTGNIVLAGQNIGQPNICYRPRQSMVSSFIDPLTTFGNNLSWHLATIYLEERSPIVTLLCLP
jgi:hypothetical protein